MLAAMSSPRPWGCFFVIGFFCFFCFVFPTPVGVFPLGKKASNYETSLPHARGGVSVGGSPFDRATASSPRPWGCFPVWAADTQRRILDMGLWPKALPLKNFSTGDDFELTRKNRT